MSESRLHAQKLAQPGGQGPISRGPLSNFFNPWLTNPLRNEILSANCNEEKTHEPTNSSTSKIDFEAKPEEILNSTKKSFNSERGNKHPKENPQTFRCLQCPLIFENSSAMIDHHKLHAKLLEEDANPRSSDDSSDDEEILNTYLKVKRGQRYLKKKKQCLNPVDNEDSGKKHTDIKDIKEDIRKYNDYSSHVEKSLKSSLKNQRIPKRKIQWQNPVKSYIVGEVTDRKWRKSRSKLEIFEAKERYARFKQRRTKSWVELVRNCHQIHFCSSNEPRVIDQVRSETKSMSDVNGE